MRRPHRSPLFSLFAGKQRARNAESGNGQGSRGHGAQTKEGRRVWRNKGGLEPVLLALPSLSFHSDTLSPFLSVSLSLSLSLSLFLFLSLSLSLSARLCPSVSPSARPSALRGSLCRGGLGTTVTSSTRWGFFLTQAGPLPRGLRHGRGVPWVLPFPCRLCRFALLVSFRAAGQKGGN